MYLNIHCHAFFRSHAILMPLAFNIYIYIQCYLICKSENSLTLYELEDNQRLLQHKLEYLDLLTGRFRSFEAQGEF